MGYFEWMSLMLPVILAVVQGVKQGVPKFPQDYSVLISAAAGVGAGAFFGWYTHYDTAVSLLYGGIDGLAASGVYSGVLKNLLPAIAAAFAKQTPELPTK